MRPVFARLASTRARSHATVTGPFNPSVILQDPEKYPQSLESVYEQAKKENYHLQIANQIYARGARLPQFTEREFYFELASQGQISRAIELWRQNILKNKRFWRSTGVILLCKSGNLVEAETLAEQGVDEAAEMEIACTHAKHQNVAEALQWLKGVSPQKREPVMDLLASDSFFSRKISKPAAIAAHISQNPSLLNNPAGLLRGLSGSKIKLQDADFWKQNHNHMVRSELLRQGVRPKEDTPITVDRCLILLDGAISARNYALADKIFNQRPHQRTLTRSPRMMQLELRYYQFKADYASAFACIDPIPKTLNMPNWSLVWSIMRSFDPQKNPLVVAPNPQSLYRSMVASRGIHTCPKTLNNIIDVFLREPDFGFLLAILDHWTKTSGQLLPSQTINFLSQRSRVPVSTLRSLDAQTLTRALCGAYGADFEKAQTQAKSIYF